MSSSLTPPRISAAFVGALVGAAAGIPLVTAAGTFSITVSGAFAGPALGVPAPAGTVVGVAVTPGKHSLEFEVGIMSSPRGSAASLAPPPPQGGTSAPVGRFGALAGWAQRHRWAALVLWVAVVAAITLGSTAAGTAYQNDFSLPGTDSQAATDLFRKHGSDQAGDSVEIVFKDTAGIKSAKAGIDPMLAKVKQMAGVADVRSPFADASAVSEDGTVPVSTQQKSSRPER